MFELICSLFFRKSHYYNKCIELLNDLSKNGVIYPFRDRDKRQVLYRLRDKCLLVRKRAYAGSVKYVVNKAFIDLLESELTMLKGVENKIDTYCLDQSLFTKKSGKKRHFPLFDSDVNQKEWSEDEAEIEYIRIEEDEE